MLQEARARWLGELAEQESKIAPVRRPSKVARGTARWLGELAVQQCKLSLVSRPGKVARGTSETRQGCKRHKRGGSVNLSCRKKVNRHGLADPGRLQEARARWLGELAV
ncbi:hypothetical protein CRG98_006042 [Punica granatum]|uniref:Uncharacterized protein n=1 Tax=Punica granatum TaxID=22663 RepID=A0A2I0KYQ9_PUNGR|nr:hypothetical protein CRG98_006042 [Punica granatum]